MVRILPCTAVIVCSVLFQGLSLSEAESSKKSEGLIYSTFRGQPGPSKDVLFDLIRQVRWDTGASDQNPQGLRLRFEKVDGQAPSGTGLPRYRVFADGAPENKVYTMGVWLVGKELSYGSQEIYANSQGLLMIHRPTPGQETSFKAPGDELTLAPQATTAEPLRYILTSKDQELSVLGTLVPHPVTALDQDCSLELRIAEPNAAAVMLVLDRFPPGARVPIVLDSEGETASLVTMTDSGGHAEVVDFPSVQGKTQGTLKATAEGSNCLPSTVLPWGAGTPASKTE
jgi:hypothetical protein